MPASLLSSLVFFALLGCGSNPPAPVEDRYARAAPSSRIYDVQRGDTLYSIAFRYGLDFRGVAAANSIPAPYTIFPGQKIQLKEATPAPAKAAVVARPAAKSGSARGSVAGPVPSGSAPLPGNKSVEKSQPVTKTPSTGSTKSNASGVYTGRAVTAWRWPTSGRVTRRFSSSVHKGIDIGGKRGDAVEAVAAGKVVYAGTGIVGFGELLIIKHNDIYLSAYGHNDRLLVVEGQTVRAGQKIAAKGSTGTDTVKLHFEIRKEGKPVNPMRLLPGR